MAEWLEQASQWHEMYRLNLEVTSSIPGQLELWVCGTSVLSRTWTKNSVEFKLSSGTSAGPFPWMPSSFTPWKHILPCKRAETGSQEEGPCGFAQFDWLRVWNDTQKFAVIVKRDCKPMVHFSFFSGWLGCVKIQEITGKKKILRCHGKSVYVLLIAEHSCETTLQINAEKLALWIKNN